MHLSHGEIDAINFRHNRYMGRCYLGGQDVIYNLCHIIRQVTAVSNSLRSDTIHFHKKK